MICFFTYLITFQSLQRNISIRPRTYLQVPLMIPAQAGDYIGKLTGTGTASCHKIPARSTSFIQSSDMRRCPAGVGDGCRPISNMCPARKVLHARGFRTFHHKANTPPCTQRLSVSRCGKGMHQAITQGKSLRILHRTRESRKGSTQHQLQIGVGT